MRAGRRAKGFDNFNRGVSVARGRGFLGLNQRVFFKAISAFAGAVFIAFLPVDRNHPRAVGPVADHTDNMGLRAAQFANDARFILVFVNAREAGKRGVAG